MSDPTGVLVTPYSIAKRFIGLHEVTGQDDNHQILAFLHLAIPWASHDEVPWCSAFVNWCCWILDLPRSGSAAARSWLKVGVPITLDEAQRGFDIVILNRLNGPGIEVLDAPGHVGFFDDVDRLGVQVLGGNQGDKVSVAHFPARQVLGFRRIYIP